MLRHKYVFLTKKRKGYMQHITKSVKHTAGTFIECENKFLTLLRVDKTWGLASGGIEEGETPKVAACREIFEETGLKVSLEDLHQIGTVHIELDNMSVIYPTFTLRVAEPFSVLLDPKEHTDCKWVTLKECREMNLIEGFRQIINEVYAKEKTKKRT